MNQESTKSVMPNFLVIGAMKSGTSSLYQYLEQHPDIFMSPVKEPAFFAAEATDLPIDGPGIQEWIVHLELKEDLASYQELFKNHNQEKAIGEATPTYICSQECAVKIHKYVPNIKLIAILRNPVDRAFSHYVWAVREGLEKLNSFSDALKAENSRIKDNWGIQWRYRNASFYYQQLKPYYEIFAREQIKVCLYENLATNPQLFMQEIFEFLEVDINFTPV